MPGFFESAVKVEHPEKLTQQRTKMRRYGISKIFSYVAQKATTPGYTKPKTKSLGF